MLQTNKRLQRQKSHHPQRGNETLQLTSPWEQWKPKKQWNGILEVNGHQPRIPYLVNVSLQNRDEMKLFLDKQQLREFITALNETLMRTHSSGSRETAAQGATERPNSGPGGNHVGRYKQTMNLP